MQPIEKTWLRGKDLNLRPLGHEPERAIHTARPRNDIVTYGRGLVKFHTANGVMVFIFHWTSRLKDTAGARLLRYIVVPRRNRCGGL